MSGSDTTKRVTIKEEVEEIPAATREDSAGGPETWDTDEVDYLLSHLVDASSIGGNQQQQPQHGSLPVFSSSSSSNRATPLQGADDDDDDEPRGFPPPATPAVQFYAGHHHYQHAKPASHNGEMITAQPAVANPVLTSMAASLVTGGPVLQQQVQQQQHPFDPSDGSKKPGLTESPISPAAIIGSGQENLMLPPPPQYGVDKEALQKQRELEKQQHLAWLQQINALARMSNQQQQQQQQQGQAQQAVPMMMAQQQQQQQAMAGQQQPPMIQHAGFPPIPPAVAAALYAGALSNGGASSQKQPESEEKRAKRLARNAESARNSRRRKKERLQLLSQQVAKLYGQLEEQRREVMRSMEPSLQQERQNAIAALYSHSDSVTEAQLHAFLQQHSPNRIIRQAVMTFQFAQWRQLLLPRYQEFLLWWTAQPVSFLTAAREERAKSDAAQSSKSTPGRVSSKQIGKELTQAWEKSKTKEEEDESKPNSCGAYDALRMWPLLCHELEVGVDQEERMLQVHRKSQNLTRLENDRSQMADATMMVVNMCKGLKYQCHAASMRSDTALTQILTPAQSVRFLHWFTRNRDACRQLIIDRRPSTPIPDTKDASLSDICRRLNEALRLPTNDTIEE